MIKSGVKIGDAVNLLYGLKPLWDVSDARSSPFFSLPKNPTTAFEPCIVKEENTDFSLPIITIHDNVQSLVDSLYEYKVLPFKGEEKNFKISSGALILNNEDNDNIISQLSSHVGVSLKKKYSYMLVKLRRLNGKASHEVIKKISAKCFDKQHHLTREGRIAMSRLRPGKKLGGALNYDSMITEKQAKDYMDFFYDFGTHFVSSLYFGDYIFQVFAYSIENFEIVKNAYKNDCIDGEINGNFALSYSYYTGRKLVAEYGKIVIKSGDPELEKSLENNEWIDERYAKGNSIFTAFTKRNVTQNMFLSQFKRVVPIGFELTPLNRFIEIFRSFSWQRILKGALLERYGDSVEFSVPRLKNDCWDFAFEDSEDELLSKVETALVQDSSCEIKISRNILDVEKLEMKKAKSLVLLSNVLKVPDNAIISLPGCLVSILSYLVDTAKESRKAPHLIVSDKAFEGFELINGKMCGMLWVENQSATKHYVIIDGFCFEEGIKDEITGRFKVALKSMRTKSIKPFEKDIRELLAKRIVFNYEDSKSISEAHSYFAWLKGLTDGKIEDNELSNIIAELEELYSNKKRPIEKACLLDKIPGNFIEKKKEYNEMSRFFMGELKKVNKQDMQNEAVLKELGFLMLYYFDDLVRLRSEIEKVIEMVYSKHIESILEYKLVNEINNQHIREVEKINSGVKKGLRNFWIVELTYKIRFQKKQIQGIFEMLRCNILEQKEKDMLQGINQTTPATVDNLIEQMTQNHSVVNGWDVVFNMLEDAVNSIFQMSFRKTTNILWKQIDISYCECFPNPEGSGQIAAYTIINYVLDSPLLSILQDKSNYMNIQFNACGSIKTASKCVDDSFDPQKDANPDDPLLSWNILEKENMYFTAEVPMSVVQGSMVQTSYSYASVLDFAVGSFDSPLFNQVMDNDRLQKELRNYFSYNNICYVINQINSQVLNQLPDLTPHFFKTGTTVTNCGKRILSLFICTTGTVKENLTVNVNEPIPDGYDFSIMINQNIAEELGGASIQQVSAFALENIIFPADNIISIGPQYIPYDMLVLGNFKLSDRIFKVNGDNQAVERSGFDIPGGEAKFAPLEVIVVDAMGSPIEGRTVTFKAASSSQSMAVQIDPGGCDTVNLNTKCDGTVILDKMLGYSVYVYYADGPFCILAGTNGGEQVNFNLTALPSKVPPILPGSKINIVSGNNQNIFRTPGDVEGGLAKFGALTVQLVDIHNNPIPNAMVNFSAGSHPNSMAVQVDPSGAEPVTVITDVNGIAVLNHMMGYGVWAYYSTGQFNVTANVAGGTPNSFTLCVTG